MKIVDHCDWRFLLSVLAILLLLDSSTFAAGSSPLYEASGPNGIRGTLTFADEPLRTMTEIPFSLKLYNAEEAAVVDAQLTVDLDMPAMPMPKNSPVATWRGDAYRGVAVFTMAGAWQLKVRVKQAGGVEDRLVFDIEQVLMK